MKGYGQVLGTFEICDSPGVLLVGTNAEHGYLGPECGGRHGDCAPSLADLGHNDGGGTRVVVSHDEEIIEDVAGSSSTP